MKLLVGNTVMLELDGTTLSHAPELSRKVSRGVCCHVIASRAGDQHLNYASNGQLWKLKQQQQQPQLWRPDKGCAAAVTDQQLPCRIVFLRSWRHQPGGCTDRVVKAVPKSSRYPSLVQDRVVKAVEHHMIGFRRAGVLGSLFTPAAVCFCPWADCNVEGAGDWGFDLMRARWKN